MTTTKYIRIGENNWIKWKEFDPMDHSSLIEIDDLLQHSFAFWNDLERVCAAECCGIDAFTFLEDDILRASNKMDKNRLLKDLNILITSLTASNKTIVCSDKLNNLIDKQVFIELLNHITKTIERNVKIE